MAHRQRAAVRSQSWCVAAEERGPPGQVHFSSPFGFTQQRAAKRANHRFSHAPDCTLSRPGRPGIVARSCSNMHVPGSRGACQADDCDERAHPRLFTTFDMPRELRERFQDLSLQVCKVDTMLPTSATGKDIDGPVMLALDRWTPQSAVATWNMQCCVGQHPLGRTDTLDRLLTRIAVACNSIVRATTCLHTRVRGLVPEWMT